MEKNTQDKADELVIKNQVLVFNEDELLDVYCTKELFETFLYRISLIEEYEPQIFTIDKSNIDTVQRVISNGRFKYRNKSITEKSNELIVSLNRHKNNFDHTDEFKNKIYMFTQLEVRDYPKDTTLTTLEALMSYDVIAFDYITTKEQKSITVDYFYSSINYLLNFMPEIFEDEITFNNTVELIDEIIKQSTFSIDILRKDTRELIKKLKHTKESLIHEKEEQKGKQLVYNK